MPKQKISLSLVIPVFNEASRIHKLNEVFTYTKKHKSIKEVIVVDDGSKDNTRRLLFELKNKHAIKIISYSKNKGKGFAIKKGMLAAKGTHALFIDVDLSTPLSTIGTLIKVMPGFDIIIGTRKNKMAKVEQRQPIIREVMGRGFTLLSQILLGVHVTDFTCGFKCFSIKSAREIFSRQTIERWSFDSEALFFAKKYNYSVGEIPVVWRNDPNTKVRFPQDVVISILELLKIIMNDKTDVYKNNHLRTHNR